MCVLGVEIGCFRKMYMSHWIEKVNGKFELS